MPVERVLLAEPRGFCAGVEKAIKALAWMVRVFEPPVYCYHEIVHNRHVVDQFRARGVIFVDDVDEVPAGAPLMLSAHGSAPEVVAAARPRWPGGGRCRVPAGDQGPPRAEGRANKGYTVLYVGHQGHEEAVGTMAVAPASVRLVRAEDVDESTNSRTDDGRPGLALLAQTTLSHDEWAGIVSGPGSGSPTCGCPTAATCASPPPTGRRAEGRGRRSDAVVVIGSENSSNTRALEKVAGRFGCPAGDPGERGRRAPRRPVGHGGGHRRGLGPRGAGRAVVARLAPRRGTVERRPSPSRRSTSHLRPSCATCSGASRRPLALLNGVRTASRARSRPTAARRPRCWPKTAPRWPPTCSNAWPGRARVPGRR